MADTFVEAMIDDYADLGLGEKSNSFSIVSLDHSTVVELDAVQDEEEVVGIQIFANGTLIDSLLYQDTAFSQNFASAMMGLLDA